MTTTNYGVNKPVSPNLKSVILYSLGYILYIIAATLFWFSEVNAFPAHYNLVQYFITYEKGFTPRGFVGTILKITGIEPTITTLFTFSFITVGILLALMLKIFRNRTLFLLYILSPFTIINYAYDFGRLDPLLLLIEVIALLVIVKDRKIFSKIAVIILVILGIIIHEAFLLLNFPLIAVVAATRWDKKFLPLLLLTAIIVTFTTVHTKVDPQLLQNIYGKFFLDQTDQPFTQPSLSSFQKTHPIAKYLNYPITKSAMIEHLNYPITRHLKLVYREVILKIPHNLHKWALLALILLPYIYLFTSSSYVISKKIASIPIITPLSLLFVGIDNLRWFSASVTHILLVTELFSKRIHNLPIL